MGSEESWHGDEIRCGAGDGQPGSRWPDPQGRGGFGRSGASLYLTHPVTVVTLVQRFGGTEDQVVAALLHDVLEEEGGAGVV